MLHAEHTFLVLCTLVVPCAVFRYALQYYVCGLHDNLFSVGIL